MSEIRIYIDGIEVTGESGGSILDFAVKAGAHIPTLCHDDRTAAYGACGICVVEAEGMPRLLRACSTAAADGMKIHTDTERVRKTRRTVLELLLSDHSGDCRPPCMLACPGQTDCQGYVGLIVNGEYREAAELIKEKLPLPSSVGRICPHPCEDACRRELVEEPVSISFLKYFATDIDINSENPFIPEAGPDTGKKVAVIGGGPGGLTAAYFLRKLGHAAVVYDQMPEMGGMLRYGIPEYRLPREVLAKETRLIEKMGVKMLNNVKIGRDISFDNIRKNYDAVIIAVGAWVSTKLGCPGEDTDGVIGGIDFLRAAAMHTAEPLTGKKAAIVGGGNTAMDACRTAVRLGAETAYNIYRRTRAEMPAEPIEIDEAIEEGVVFLNLTNPIEVISENGKVRGIRLQKMTLGESDAGGRRAPVPLPGEEQLLDVDVIISAIGQSVDIGGFEGLELTKRKTIAADEKNFLTNLDGVFAVGDATNKGPDIAIAAIGEARKAAYIVDSYLSGGIIPYSEPYLVKREMTEEDFTGEPRINRAEMPHLLPGERKTCFNEVNLGFSEEAARKEASRCLSCGCQDYFECKLINYSGRYLAEPEKFSGTKHKRHMADDHPYISRNPDKCILCGLCMRICDEAMGVTAFGLVGRGFGTEVKPALGMPLRDTDCISCGQCVSACPTGALAEKITAHKAVPVAEKLTPSVCVRCDVGCLIKVASKGSMILRVLPDTERDPECILCESGRFGFYEPEKAERVASPFIRRNGALEPAELPEALAAVKESIDMIIQKYGAGSVAVSVSGTLTCEEMALALRYARDVIGTRNIFSFDNDGVPGRYKAAARIAGLKGLAAPKAANFRELKNLGIIAGSAEILGDFGKKIKGIVTFGGTPAFDASGLELLCVMDLTMSENAQNAHIVLPCAGMFETSGTVISQDGSVNRLNAAVSPKSGYGNMEVINGLL